MKSIICLLVFCTLILAGCKKEDLKPDIVNIPDNNFLNLLIDMGVDTDGDSLISSTEAEVVTTLEMRGRKCLSPEKGAPALAGDYPEIKSLEGIGAFINLDTLICCSNGLSSLDLSGNTALRYLNCWFCGLTRLNISENIILSYLDCGANPLTGIDLSANTGLVELICDHNQFPSLDISNNNNIIELSMAGMPALSEVCVWTMPFPPAGVKIDTTLSPNVYFTTDCGR
ncbi:hypothetical protein ACFLTA_05435 [Bacteroidota bacterium]